MSKPEKPDPGAVNRAAYIVWADRAAERIRSLSGEKAEAERRRVGAFVESLRERVKSDRLPSLVGIDDCVLDNLKVRAGV